jgi:NTE family protein
VPGPDVTRTRALVLGGGGVAGIAWELGLIAELGARGVDLTAADLVVGTSAGSTVAAQITSGVPLQGFVDAQFVESKEIPTAYDPVARRAFLDAVIGDAADGAEAAARIGAMAMAADTIPEAVRREVVGARLPVHAWPAQRLVVVAVDAVTGEIAPFDAGSGVDLVDAVAASCAVPGVWPTTTIGGRRYVDGGARSHTHAHLAEGWDAVLVVAPFLPPGRPAAALEAELAVLRPRSDVLVVEADGPSAAVMSISPLDPANRAPAVRAAREQATRIVDDVAAFWR